MIGFAQPAAAHNSFASSDPADGAPLTVAPQRLVLTFGSAVVLAQLQVDYTDASGVRSALSGFDFGPSGQTNISVPVPDAASGEVSFRWKLVGADGHIVSGRVGLSIAAPSAAPAASAAPTSPPSEAPAELTVETTTETTETVLTIASDSTPAPSVVKWLLRVLGLLGLVMVGGAVVTSAILWTPAWHEEVVRRAAGWGIAPIAGSTALSLAIFAKEATGLGVALGTSHGVALAARLVIVPLVGLALFQWYADDAMQRLTGMSVGLDDWPPPGVGRDIRDR